MWARPGNNGERSTTQLLGYRRHDCCAAIAPPVGWFYAGVSCGDSPERTRSPGSEASASQVNQWSSRWRLTTRLSNRTELSAFACQLARDGLLRTCARAPQHGLRLLSVQCCGLVPPARTGCLCGARPHRLSRTLPPAPQALPALLACPPARRAHPCRHSAPAAAATPFATRLTAPHGTAPNGTDSADSAKRRRQRRQRRFRSKSNQ